MSAPLGKYVTGAFRVLGLAAGAALFVSWQLTPVPIILKALPLGLFVLSLVRPSAGLLVMAGLGPVIGALAFALASPFGGTHAFEQLVLAVVIGAGLRTWRDAVPLQLSEPALFLAAVAVASVIAILPAMWLYQNPGASTAEHLRTLLSGGYFDPGMIGQPLSVAVMTVEALALAVVAERLVRGDQALAPQLVRMVVVSHAGLAMISISRIIGAALHTEHPAAAIVRLMRDVRISTYVDSNAAGSVLAMVLVAGMGLVAGFRSRWLTLTALPVIAVGLWLTGSRTAMLALGLGLLGLSIREGIQRRTWGRLLAVGVLAGAIAIGVWVASYPATRNVAASTAIGFREFMSRVAVDMWRSAPVLGVGVGRFWVESARFGGSERPYGIVNENAHNNFLQVLAEEGLVGLIALLLVLATLFVATVRTSQSPFKRFLATGIVVFVLTWLGGHPLLLAEAGFVFWLLAGVLSGVTNPPSVSRWRMLLVLAAAALLITGPVRADRAIREADFEHIGTGVSGWRRPDLDGVRYREANATFQLYLPSDGTPVTLPLRRAPNAPDPLLVAAHVGRQSVARVLLTGDAWLDVPIQLQKANRRFELVDFAVSGADSSTVSPLVLVGKTTVRSR